MSAFVHVSYLGDTRAVRVRVEGYHADFGKVEGGVYFEVEDAVADAYIAAEEELEALQMHFEDMIEDYYEALPPWAGEPVTARYQAGKGTTNFPNGAPSVFVEILSEEEADQRRRDLLESLGLSEADLRERAASYSLTGKELAVLSQIDGLDYLTGGKAGRPSG